ncbi:MAG: DNA topoisomerase 4 subunit A [Clostridiales bacterium]|jgi:DNA gyrase subunit A|nr:DNA topoisomerase 4 subunit A [Clostridiales bacterium]
MADKEITPQGNNIHEKSIETVMHDSMMPYSEYVILDRALPRVEDGLKPVQRRIMYTMLELGLESEKPYRKSARIVGDCLGKYHPHGDTSIYFAMVRMAQSFNMRMPLVDGHGNYGSIDGDVAAAMRYTEARLTPLAMELLRDLEKSTVNWSLNFDDTLKEPDTLPGRYPNLLVNGASGIAVGLATNIPTHNLTEVIDGVFAMMDKPNITLKEMMKIIKGPDFPTAGYLICGEELETAYETGRGKVTLRAKIHIEEFNDKKAIVVTELPFQVNKSALLQKILNLREDKKELLGGITEIVDESDRTGIRAVVRIKKDADADEIIKYLCKHTDLQMTFGINMVAIANGKPEQLGLLQMLRYYIDYQLEVIRRRTDFDLKQAKAREHILIGLVIAIENIDEVIAIIKSSKNTTQARERLKERFLLDDLQAQAILDMRLARLTALEIEKLVAELEEIRKLIEKLTAILKSHKLQMQVIKDELNEIKKAYKTPRLTVLVGSQDEIQTEIVDDVLPYREGFLVAQNRTLKCVGAKSFGYYTKDISNIGDDDFIDFSLFTDNRKELMAFSSLGNIFRFKLDALPEVKMKDKGIAFGDLFTDIQPNENIIKIFAYDTFPEGDLYQFTANGMIKKSKWSEYNIGKAYYQSVVLKDDDCVTACENVVDEANIFFVTEQGLCLNAKADDVPLQGRRSGGVKGIQLGDGDKIIMMTQVDDSGEIVLFTDKGYAKRVLVAEIEPMKRYRKGVKIIEFGAQNGSILYHASYVKQPYDIAVVKENGAVVSFNTEDIKIENRTTKGKNMLKDKTEIKRIRKYFR